MFARLREDVATIFKKDPAARVFIYVGYSHLMKKERDFGGESAKKVQWMAGRLKAATGIDPLTIEQTTMTDPVEESLNAAIVREIFSADAARENVVVLRRTNGALDKPRWVGES